MEKQPNSAHCFVCGVKNPHGLHLKFYEKAPGEIVAETTVSDEYQGYPGVVHGGIIAAMLDEATGRSQMRGDSQRFMYTAQLSIRYRKPVPVGKLLHITGHAGKIDGRVCWATGEIHDSDGILLATAEAVLVDVPKTDLSAMDMERLGWRVYADEEET